jgi:hypothetical protein
MRDYGRKMLSNEDLNRIYQQAYLPEHLPVYVEAISGAQPHLHGNYLCFTRKSHLIFIGYPLGRPSDDTARAYASACERFDPATVALIAPEVWLNASSVEMQPRDSYYRLHLPVETIDPNRAYMVRRAERELTLGHGSFQKEHKKLIKAFIKDHQLTAEQIYVYNRIGQYLKRASSAHLLEARKQEVLVAFTVVDTGSADYAFYLFNFRSPKQRIPGASDLLFKTMVDLARSEGKKSINLGLGIHEGIRRFKEKWGGVPFLPYAAARVDRKQPLMSDELANKL